MLRPWLRRPRRRSQMAFDAANFFKFAAPSGSTSQKRVAQPARGRASASVPPRRVGAAPVSPLSTLPSRRPWTRSLTRARCLRLPGRCWLASTTPGSSLHGWSLPAAGGLAWAAVSVWNAPGVAVAGEREVSEAGSELQVLAAGAAQVTRCAAVVAVYSSSSEQSLLE